MNHPKQAPAVRLFFDGTQNVTDAFVGLIERKNAAHGKETLENKSDIHYNKDTVHFEEAAGLVS